MSKPRLVVVGNGMAGIRTVEEVLRLDRDRYEITVFGAEPHGNYNRILLSPVLAGEKTFDDIVTHPREWYLEHGITFHAGDPIVAIDRKRRVARSRDGRGREAAPASPSAPSKTRRSPESLIAWSCLSRGRTPERIDNKSRSNR